MRTNTLGNYVGLIVSSYIMMAFTMIACKDPSDNGVTGEEPPCIACSQQQFQTALSLQPFVVFWVDDTSVLVSDGEQDEKIYLICDENKWMLEEGKMIKLAGSVYSICQQPAHYRLDGSLEVDSLVIIESCLPAIDTIPGKQVLEGSWMVLQLNAGSGLDDTPCESTPTYLTFQQTGGRWSFGVRGIGGDVIVTDSTLITTSITVTLELEPTHAANEFRANLGSLVGQPGAGALLNYEIFHNFLILENPDNGFAMIAFRNE